MISARNAGRLPSEFAWTGRAGFTVVQRGRSTDERFASEWEAGGAAYREQLRKAYGSLTNPVRRFALDAANREPYRVVAEDLAELGQVVDDTDVNCDVCFTLVLHSTSLLIVKLSMVGPYALVLSFGQDGLAPRAVLLGASGDVHTGELVTRVVSILERHGLIMVPRAHLESCVPLAIRSRSWGVTLYSALFEPESDIPW